MWRVAKKIGRLGDELGEIEQSGGAAVARRWQWAVDARVTLEHDNTKAPERQFKCSIRLGVRGPDLYAEDCDGDLYAAIDKATKKIEQQIRKRHNKYKARKHGEAAVSKRRRQEAGI